MELNQIGELADRYWYEIPEHFPFVELGNFVVMPNHIHGILIINKLDTAFAAPAVQTKHCLVSANPTDNPHHPRFRNPGKNNIPSIIGSYKSVVSKNVHYIHADFAWQSRFHDHVIRNEPEYYRIANYIENNIKKWKEDKFS